MPSYPKRTFSGHSDNDAAVSEAVPPSITHHRSGTRDLSDPGSNEHRGGESRYLSPAPGVFRAENALPTEKGRKSNSFRREEGVTRPSEQQQWKNRPNPPLILLYTIKLIF